MAFYQSSKSLMHREKSAKRDFTDPDPHRSKLCDECDDFIRSLHSHPWTDPENAPSSIKRSPLSLQKDPSRQGWRPFDITELSLQRIADSCALCAVVGDILSTNIHLWQSQEASLPQHTGYYILQPSLFGRVPDLDPRRVFGQVGHGARKYFQRWCLGIVVATKPGKNESYNLPGAIHCAPVPVPKFSTIKADNVPFEQRSILHGRFRPLVCEINQIKSWMSTCDRCHGAECDRTISDGITIRLIDTRDQCIVLTHLSSSRQVSYVALSYIWGNKTQAYASSAETYAALHVKGALRNVKLSQTVADAVLLVQKLGLRYLWVDALCIQQTSAMDKHDQIAQMGFVYQSAMFTIVAAAGNDCDAGLAGLRPGTRFKGQGFARAGDYALMSALQIPGDKILTPQTSKWALRGWTLQEDLLSACQLIFTDEQIWWRCSCATWCESANLETTDPVGFFLPGESVKSRLEDRYSTLKPEQYFKLVSDYAGRQLSYASDALNAFSGILSVLTRYSGTRFLQALMTTNFERQLYWFGKATVRPGTGNNEFPSWSWVSSQGDISFAHYLTYKPSIECYTIHEGQGGYEAVRVCTLTANNTAINSTTFSDSTIFEATTENDRQVKLDTLVRLEDIQSKYMAESLEADFHLFFYTYTATFYLMPQGRLILPDLKPRFAKNSRGVIIGPKPDYGYLVPSLDDAELCDKGERECILLGRRPPASEWDAAHVVVMLVARDGGTIRRRLGIADMPEEFWDLADKKWELIVLG